MTDLNAENKPSHDMPPLRSLGKGRWVIVTTTKGEEKIGILNEVKKQSFEVHLVHRETGETIGVIPDVPFDKVRLCTSYEQIPACRRPKKEEENARS